MERGSTGAPPPPPTPGGDSTSAPNIYFHNNASAYSKYGRSKNLKRHREWSWQECQLVPPREEGGGVGGRGAGNAQESMTAKGLAGHAQLHR